eukprot:11661300-Heterocapsa_arctica.AAC.1
MIFNDFPWFCMRCRLAPALRASPLAQPTRHAPHVCSVRGQRKLLFASEQIEVGLGENALSARQALHEATPIDEMLQNAGCRVAEQLRKARLH